MNESNNVRNFCIIAHIDHGKSTLADRLIERSGLISQRQMREQYLDDMDLERERGITIKSHAVTMHMNVEGKEYIFNLIDTPGHVDFTYEVSRSMAACEGAILLIDASQGVQAQTMANAEMAKKQGLKILPVVNKIDLPSAMPEDAAIEMEQLLGLDSSETVFLSAKTGEGIDEICEKLVSFFPPPQCREEGACRAMIFDAVYNEYKGVIIYVRLFEGLLKKKDMIEMLKTGHSHEVLELGCFEPDMTPREELRSGDVGYVIANIKELDRVHIGDTISQKGSGERPLSGYSEPKPVVFCGFYPATNNEFDELKKSLEKLHINDCSFVFEPDSSQALGFGFRCGFLGLLHMDIIRSRLERESGINIIQTAPSVTYQILTKTEDVLEINNPSQIPPPGEIQEFRSPFANVKLLLPNDYIGPVMKLCQSVRGNYIKTDYFGTRSVMIEYDIPFSEIVYDFYDNMKSVTRGYATMEYELTGFVHEDLAKLEILVNNEPVDALSTVVHREDAQQRGREIIAILRKTIPRHSFQIPLQATTNGKVIVRENIRAVMKDVTAKCYGGDITRKRKLWENQKEGKKRMKSVGNVEISQDAFLSVLKTKN